MTHLEVFRKTNDILCLLFVVLPDVCLKHLLPLRLGHEHQSMYHQLVAQFALQPLIKMSDASLCSVLNQKLLQSKNSCKEFGLKSRS